MTLCVRSAGPRRVCGDLRFFIGGDPRPFTTVAAKPAGPRKPGVVESAAEARALVNRIGPAASFYKVGMELYAAAGMDFVRELLSLGKDVFLDLKFYDIGETVKRAVAQVARTGVRFLTVHSSGAVMRAAVEGRGSSPLKLLAVTVLTSFDEQDLADLGYPCSPADLVALRVRKAMEAGIDGIVASPVEARSIRSLAGPRAILVTPGVRSPG